MACAMKQCRQRTCDQRFPAALADRTTPKQPHSRAISCHRQRHAPLSFRTVPSSIQEGHVPHGLRLTFGVHQDPVPAVQGDRGVVGVPNPATDVDPRMPLHRPPAPALCLRVAGQDALVLRLGDAVMVAGADVDRLASRPVAEFCPMGLAAVASTQRLVLQDQLLVHTEASDGEEEPLALASVGGILAAVAGLAADLLPSLGHLHFNRLQRFLGLTNGADRGVFGQSGNEPVALVMAAEELALILALSDLEEQVTVGGLHVQDGDLGLGVRLADDLEELALTVSLHVQGEDACRAIAASRTVSDFEACADASKLDVEKIRVHEKQDTAAEGRVRSEVVSKMTMRRTGTASDEGTRS